MLCYLMASSHYLIQWNVFKSVYKTVAILLWPQYVKVCSVQVVEPVQIPSVLFLYRCLRGKLWYLQHNCDGDTIVYHLTADIKMPSYKCSDSHYKGKTDLRPLYLYDAIAIPEKMVFILKQGQGYSSNCLSYLNLSLQFLHHIIHDAMSQLSLHTFIVIWEHTPTHHSTDSGPETLYGYIQLETIAT